MMGYQGALCDLFLGRHAVGSFVISTYFDRYPRFLDWMKGIIDHHEHRVLSMSTIS